jgi:RNA polymerase sigma-70 factor (ECF subfamily)
VIPDCVFYARNHILFPGVFHINDLSGEARLDESTLIRHAANGDAAAWEPLVLAHQEAVFRLAYLILGDPDDAADVAQEAFLRAWNHIQRFDPTRSLRPWLLGIVTNLARNRYRSAGRYLAALRRAFRNEPAPANTEEKSAQHLEASELWKAVQSLSMPDQQIVYLRFFLDLSVAETAEVLRVADGTVKSRLSRALERLRGIIQQEFPVLAEGHEGRDA